MPASDAEFEELLQLLRAEHGFDFTGYKRASLRRRVQRRMDALRVSSYADYTECLKKDGEEFTALFNTILINVTSFFRDRESWDHLAAVALPDMLAEKPPASPIRVWSAGCASGEEAHTLAIVLGELLGAEEFSRRVKIYATDVDDDALTHARSGYSAKELAPLGTTLLEKYFQGHGSRHTLRPEFRRALIFGRHDLVHDAPISKLDLAVCRNTLMYFDAPTQRRILHRLHYALNPTGLLFLGKAEMLLTHAHLFRPRNLKYRIFMRTEPGPGAAGRQARGGTGDNVGPMIRKARIRDLAQESSPVAQISVDPDGDLVLANEEARRLFVIRVEDIGRPLRDLELSYRPVELRSRIEQASDERRQVEVSGVELRTADGDVRLIDVRVYPLIDPDGTVQGTNVSFSDVTRYLELQRDLERSRLELETAYEELQSANEELQTTNEELQSTVEELETTNEELQSSNEELETMNEELESTNTELQTINNDLQLSTADFESFRGLTDSVYSSMNLAVIALDLDFQVRSWTPPLPGCGACAAMKHLGNNSLAWTSACRSPSWLGRSGIASAREPPSTGWSCARSAGRASRCYVGSGGCLSTWMVKPPASRC
ncbi:MAG: CheR family methyltransferase [Candidatus Dormibacteria bacterium]